MATDAEKKVAIETHGITVEADPSILDNAEFLVAQMTYGDENATPADRRSATMAMLRVMFGDPLALTHALNEANGGRASMEMLGEVMGDVIEGIGGKN